MRAVKFVMAFPVESDNGASYPIERAESADMVCGPGPRLWSDSETPLIDLVDGGVVLGILFSRKSGTPVLDIPSARSFPSDPEFLANWLVQKCWGGYFAALRQAGTGKFALLVDPAGQCPVYKVQTQTHVIVASHPELLQQASGNSLNVSWQALYAHLRRPDLRQRVTCLEGVTELAPGELVQSGGGPQSTLALWHPQTFIPSGPAPTYQEAAEELHSIAVKVIGAWAQRLGPVAVAASGGVDSSFICAALAKAQIDFSCITVATSDPSSDESQFVRLLGRHLGRKTICATFDLERIDPLRAASAGLPRPSRKSFMAALDTAVLEAGTSVGAAAVFDGNGGDSLFCFLHSAAPIVDRLRSERSGSGLVSTFLDMCKLTDCDAPTMAKAVMRRLFREQRFGEWVTDHRLLSDYDCPLIDPVSTWRSTDVGPHGGKQDHLVQIMRTQNNVHGVAACGLPRLSVLMSQPLVEYCLSVPTWLWCTGGINRALARDAFAAELPREIMLRTSKAGPESFLHSMFAKHRRAIRDLLMDGLLARHGLIDRSAVDKAMQVDALSGGATIYRILDLTEAENWARSWRG